MHFAEVQQDSFSSTPQVKESAIEAASRMRRNRKDKHNRELCPSRYGGCNYEGSRAEWVNRDDLPIER